MQSIALQQLDGILLYNQYYLFNKFYSVQLLVGVIIRHLVKRPTSNRLRIGLKYVQSGSQRPLSFAEGFFRLGARELARRRGPLQKTRPDEGGKVSWELITTRVNSISLPERLTV